MQLSSQKDENMGKNILPFSSLIRSPYPKHFVQTAVLLHLRDGQFVLFLHGT